MDEVSLKHFYDARAAARADKKEQIKKGQVVHLLLHPRAEVFCKGNGAQAAA